MTHNIINTETYLLIVDDSEIKEGDYCLMFDDYGNSFLGNTPQKYLGESAGHFLNKGLKKVISHLPLNNSPILEGVDLLPPIEDERLVVKLNHVYSILHQNGVFNTGKEELLKAENLLIQARIKANEKYKYTEEDIENALEFGWNLSHYHRSEPEDKLLLMQKNFIQSLQQPKIPVGFKRKESGSVISGGLRTGHESQPPGLQTHTLYEVITNLESGQTQWVGEYIFYFV